MQKCGFTPRLLDLFGPMNVRYGEMHRTQATGVPVLPSPLPGNCTSQYVILHLLPIEQYMRKVTTRNLYRKNELGLVNSCEVDHSVFTGKVKPSFRDLYILEYPIASIKAIDWQGVEIY